jgi:hypothetical protein
MKQRLMRSGFILALVMLGALHNAQARVHVNVGIGFPGVFYAPPPPLVVARPAAFWAPPVVYARHGFVGWHSPPPHHFGPRRHPHHWRRW